MAYEPRITELGDLRITESGDQRVSESSEGTGISPSGGMTSLGASVFITNTPQSDLEVRVVIGEDVKTPLGAKALIPIFVTSSKPQFSWLNSSDFDGDDITYEIQLAQDFDWGGVSSFAEIDIPEDSDGVTNYRITTDLIPDVIYNWRVRAWDGYEYSDWSEPLAVLYAVSTTVVSDLSAKVVIPRVSDLGASVFVYRGFTGKITIPTLSDLGATVNVELPYKDLGCKITIPSTSDLGAKVRIITALGATVTIPPKSDLGATMLVVPKETADLGAKIKIVSYNYTGLLAKIFVKGVSNLGAETFVIPYNNIGGKVTIETVLGATVYISPKSEVGATVNVTVEHQQLGAKVNVIQTGDKDLGGSIVVGQFLEDLPARVNVTLGDQRLNAKLNVLVLDDSDIGATVNVDTAYQQVGGKVSVIASGYVDSLQAKATIGSIAQQLKSSVVVSVIGEDDGLSSSVDVIPNTPTDVYPSGYLVPSGYPPLPSGWADPIGYAIPGPGATLVPEDTWQQEEEILFIWPPPSDWGMGATEDGYVVAWNDDENHVVTDSDQYVPNNHIQKNWYDSGDRWFHVRAKNSYGHFGPQGKYNVKINTLASAPVSPFYIDEPINTTGYTNSSQPFFYWGKATDEDQLDVLSYELQVWPSGIIPGDVDTVHIQNITQTGAGDIQEYQIAQALEVGNYEWRVRTFDSKQFSPWISYQPLIIEPATQGLGARVTIPVIDIDNLGATVNIIGYNNLGGNVNVFADLASNLGATVNVGYKVDAELGASIRVPRTDDIGGKINIIQYRDLSARVNVFDVYGFGDIGATVKIGRKADAELGASITLAEYGSSDLGAMVSIPHNVDVGAKVTTYTPEHFGFIDDFSDNLSAKVHLTVFGSGEVGGSINTIADRPGIVVITANVPEATWQENHEIDFEWTATFANFLGIEGYYTQLDRVADTEATDSFQRTEIFARSFNLELLDGAGVYYFHVAAKATNGLFGPTTHFAVWYNHRVPNPSVPMLVNNQDSIAQFVMVSANSNIDFEWGQSIDPDALDAIEYKLQVATQEDFGVTILEQSSIIYEQIEVPTYFHTVSGGTLSSGTYYWRVMANDGHQDSAGWSPTGRFYLNTPPSVPSDLIVYN